MSNPIFDSVGNNSLYAGMVGQIKEFSKTLQGDPKQTVEQLLNSEKMSQQELNRYTQMAQQILPFIK